MDIKTPIDKEDEARVIFDSYPDAVFILNEAGHILDANLTAVQNYGYSLEELMRMNASELASPGMRCDAPIHIKQALESGDRFEWEHSYKDGRVIPVEVFARPMTYRGGHSILSSVRDISRRIELESELQDQSRLLQQILDTEPGTVYVYDLIERRNIYINRHWLSAFGYTPEETQAMGSAVLQLFHPEDILRIEANHAALRDIADGVMSEIEYRIRDKDGNWHWLTSRETPFARGKDGRVSQILGIATDITDHKKTEIALQENEERFRAYVDQAADAIFVHDFSGRFTEVNQQACISLGYSREELLQMSVFDVELEFDLARAQAAWSHIQPGRPFNLSGCQRRKDGSTFPVDVRFGCFDIREQRYYLGLVRDITDFNRMQEELRASEAKFRTIIEYSPLALAVNDEHQNITFLNRKFIEMFGHTLADIPTLAQWWPRAYPDPAYRQYVAQQWQAAVDKAKRDQTELEPMEYKVTGADGTERDIRFSLTQIGSSSLVILYDITALKQADAELRKLYLAVSQSSNSIVITDLEANIEYVNDTFLKLTGYSNDEVMGKNSRILQSGKTPKATYEDLWAHLTRGELWRGELINKRKDGVEYTELAVISPVRQADGMISHYLAIKENITEARKAEERIEKLARYDQLTGLPNRTQLSERSKYSISLAQRSGEPLVLMLLDLDHFKNINDTLGHTVGDQILIDVSRRIRETLREEDTVSRMGGDEFILLLPGTDADGAARVAFKLIAAISQPCLIGQHELIITPSIGISIYPNDGDELETLSKNADTAMYRAKQDGRNSFRFYTSAMQERSARTLMLTNALRHAVVRNELQLHYQPQISMLDGHVVGAEALLRWHHPELGMISPAEFIPIAEDSGQIIQIGEWVLRTVIRQLKDWLDNGLPPMVMAVNLSSAQFRQANIADLVMQVLDEVQLPPEFLELELTEAVAMGDPLAVVEVMDKLNERGIHMSIDDFGTGYSSLSYLKKFKVYKLKIDQSFVRDITVDPEDKAIVSAIINMASSLGIKTIAEGVETAGQLAFLRLHGCDEAQGYYFSKPVIAEQFEEFVKKMIL